VLVLRLWCYTPTSRVALNVVIAQHDKVRKRAGIRGTSKGREDATEQTIEMIQRGIPLDHERNISVDTQYRGTTQVGYFSLFSRFCQQFRPYRVHNNFLARAEKRR